MKYTARQLGRMKIGTCLFRMPDKGHVAVFVKRAGGIWTHQEPGFSSGSLMVGWSCSEHLTGYDFTHRADPQELDDAR